jgi:hypothetical protein
MTGALALGIDVGTSGAKGILIGADGAVIRSAVRDYPLLTPLRYNCVFYRHFMIVCSPDPAKRSKHFSIRSYSNGRCISAQGFVEVLVVSEWCRFGVLFPKLPSFFLSR